MNDSKVVTEAKLADAEAGNVKPTTSSALTNLKSARFTTLFVALCLLSALIVYGNLTASHDWGGDFATYIMQARSLVEGNPSDFMQSNKVAMEQSSHRVGPVLYPWGLPLLLAPVYAGFGPNVVAMKVIGALSFVLLPIALWLGFRRTHSPTWRLCLVALFALNPSFLSITNDIMSDMPFTILATLSLLLIDTMVVRRRTLIGSHVDPVLLGLTIAAAVLVRTNGILLIVALTWAQLVSCVLRQAGSRPASSAPRSVRAVLQSLLPGKELRIRHVLPHLLPYITFAAVFAIPLVLLPKGGASYVAAFRGSVSLEMIKQHLGRLVDLPAEFFHGMPREWLFYGITVPLAISGMIRRLRDESHVMFFMFSTVALFAVVPVNMHYRYLLPLLPFYVSYVITGLEAFQISTPVPVMEKVVRKYACILPVLLVILSFGWYSVNRAHRNIRNGRVTEFGPFTPSSQEMFRFITTHTEANSRIIFFKPTVMTLMTDRQSFMIYKSEQLSRGNYLCIYMRKDAYSQLTPARAEELVRRAEAALIYENPDFRVYSLDSSRVSKTATNGPRIECDQPMP